MAGAKLILEMMEEASFRIDSLLFENPCPRHSGLDRCQARTLTTTHLCCVLLAFFQEFASKKETAPRLVSVFQLSIQDKRD